MSSISTAAALALPLGERTTAVAILTAAGEQGDVDALMQLAVWHLMGDGIPRNVRQARVFLRQAVSIGHVDGALMEAALSANGNGNLVEPDFPGARQLLDIAAVRDPVAAEHKSLLDRMQLAEDGTPLALPTPEILSDTPRIVRYSGILTPAECRHLAAVADPLLEPAQVIDPRSNQWIPHPIRTSYGGAIGPTREDLVVRALNLRIALASGTQVSQGEPLTILRYASGQEYRPHLDTIEGAANQRIKTVLIYLNQGFGGGETHFPLVPLAIKPFGGDAIVFDNVTPDGRSNPQTRHAGLAVTQGVKWMATRWIRAQPVDPWTLS